MGKCDAERAVDNRSDRESSAEKGRRVCFASEAAFPESLEWQLVADLNLAAAVIK
jgi:hypothetical protein